MSTSRPDRVLRRQRRRPVLLATLLAMLAGSGALTSTATASPAPVPSSEEATSSGVHGRGTVSATFTVGGGVTRTDGSNGCTQFPYTFNFQGTADTGTWKIDVTNVGFRPPFIPTLRGSGPSGTGAGTYEFCGHDAKYGTHYWYAIVETTRIREDGVYVLELIHEGPADTAVTYVKPQPVLALSLSRRTVARGTPIKGRVRGTGHYGEPVAGAEANKPPAIIVQSKQPGGPWRDLLGDRILTTNEKGEAFFTFRPKTGMQVRAILKENKDYYEARSKTVQLRVPR